MRGRRGEGAHPEGPSRSGSSFGVGYEVGHTAATGKIPVVLYCTQEREPFVSKMALGSPTGVVVCDAAEPAAAAARVLAALKSAAA